MVEAVGFFSICIGSGVTKRLQLRISQTQLAQQLNVRVETIQNWEHSRSIPAVCYLPKLVDFLGYDPFEKLSRRRYWSEKKGKIGRYLF